MDNKEKRLLMIQEANSLSTGEWPNKRKFHLFYQYEEYKVGLFKPGKEAASFKITSTKIKRSYKKYIHPSNEYLKSGRKIFKKNDVAFYTAKTESEKEKINKFDSAPIVIYMGNRINGPIIPDGFNDILISICDNKKNADHTIIKIGQLLFDMANLLNHQKHAKSFRYSYKTDDKIYIYDKEFPMIVLLYFLELISLNEDIKYYSGGYKNYKKIINYKDITSRGRENNLLTMIHMIAIKRFNLNAESIMNKFLKSAVEPIKNTDLKKIFY